MNLEHRCLGTAGGFFLHTKTGLPVGGEWAVCAKEHAARFTHKMTVKDVFAGRNSIAMLLLMCTNN